MGSVFGKIHLGYVVIESARFSDWRRFGKDAIGLHYDDVARDVMRFRLDEHTCRFLVHDGTAEDVTALGWQVDDHDTFEDVLSRLRARGIPTGAGSSEEAALRGVERLARFPGPNGLTQEVYTRTAATTAPLSIGVAGGFVTDTAGLGHVAVTSKRPHRVREYYETVFDARLSDFIDETISGLKFKIRFLRVNERHHSVAIAAVNRLPINPIRTRVQHLNIQVAELEDMAASYRRVKDLGFDMALSIGQHTNDKELSFYAVTPSGFEWEVGWNPVVVDEATWEPTTHQGISIWGHTPEGRTIIDTLKQFKTGARSLLHREPELTLERVA